MDREKRLIRQHLKKLVKHNFSRIDLSDSSRMILDNSNKPTDEELILKFHSFTLTESRNMLCTVLEVQYRDEENIQSGGYVEVIIGQRDGCNWEIKNSLRLATQ